jgi:hypothetical protein
MHRWFPGKLYYLVSLIPWCVAAFLFIWIEGRRVERYLWAELDDVCNSCGYNLTGNTSGTCPECGTPVPKEPAEKSPRPA